MEIRYKGNKIQIESRVSETDTYCTEHGEHLVISYALWCHKEEIIKLDESNRPLFDEKECRPEN